MELSQTDSQLGESDITVVLEINGERRALLIENKINASAMPDQHERYLLRGRKAVKNGECAEFCVFILCPQDYRNSNTEAKLYEYFVSYEECLDLFDEGSTMLSRVRAQQFRQALEKRVRSSNTVIDPAANLFFRSYRRFQFENYPQLELRTAEESNGYWAQYRVRAMKGFIYHKIREGGVDLTYDRTSEKYHSFCSIAKILPGEVRAVVTGKSAGFRILVPKLDMRKSFEEQNRKEIEECFKAIEKLSQIDSMMDLIRDL